MKVANLVLILIALVSTPLYAKPAEGYKQAPPAVSSGVTTSAPPPWVKNAFDALSASRQSLYMITTIPKVIDQSEDGKVVLKRTPSGAGQTFLVGKNLLMSANHITEHAQVGDTVWVWNQKKISFGKIVYQHPVIDFVLIEADLPDGIPVPLKAEDHYQEAIVFLGNFYQFGNAPSTIEPLAKMVRIRNEIPALIGENIAKSSASSYLIFEGVFKPGDSGAPIFNKDGYIVGMLTKIAKNRDSDEQGNGIALGVPSRVLLLAYQDYLAEQAKKSSKP